MSIFDQFNEQEQAILRERARLAARPAEDADLLHVINALLISLQDETYALPLDAVTNVYRDMPITPVPCVPPFVAGVANLRGRITPVIDLGRLLGVEQNHERALSALLVAANDEVMVAFLTESVGEVAVIPVSQLKPLSAAIELSRPQYIQGVLPNGTILLDVPAILSDPALVIVERLN